MLCHNRDRKKVATERNPPRGSKHTMQAMCPKMSLQGVQNGKERSQETGVRRQNGAEYSKRHSARWVSGMSLQGVQNESNQCPKRQSVYPGLSIHRLGKRALRRGVSRDCGSESSVQNPKCGTEADATDKTGRGQWYYRTYKVHEKRHAGQVSKMRVQDVQNAGSRES